MNFLKRWGLKKEKKQDQVEVEKEEKQAEGHPFAEEAKAIAAAEDHYILLSTSQADMRQGFSVPYIGQLDADRRILLIFDSYDRAKAYVDKNGYEVLEGNYPIARLEKSGHETQQLLSVLNLALSCSILLIHHKGVGGFKNQSVTSQVGPANWHLHLRCFLRAPFTSVGIIH